MSKRNIRFIYFYLFALFIILFPVPVLCKLLPENILWFIWAAVYEFIVTVFILFPLLEKVCSYD